MIIPHSPFQIVDWNTITKEMHNGECGFATWQIIKIGDIRIRRVQYSPDYKADHWCSKGHIIYCEDGEMTTELEDGRLMYLGKGMTYTVGDNSQAHKSATANGCTLFIID
ncbi:MAG: DHCW motif cupin fold protein [Chitinophagaceae bacterium]